MKKNINSILTIFKIMMKQKKKVDKERLIKLIDDIIDGKLEGKEYDDAVLELRDINIFI